MGTYVTISLNDKDLSHANKAFKRLKEVEAALSSYDPQAQIYRLNHEHTISPDPDTLKALRESTGYYHQTNGYFDITIGSITKGLFHFGEHERIPSADELLAARVDFKGLHISDEKVWTEEGVLIDLGGMGKGFGVDRAKELLRANGVRKGVIALSGDIFCFHRCQMQIQNPFAEGSFARFTTAQDNIGISTSGNYRRYVRSKDYHHLINPKTRSSSKSFASITLMSATHNNSILDAYATAASVMPKVEALSFLNDQKGLGYLLVDNHKKLYINQAFRSLSRNLKLDTLEGMRERGYIKAVPLRFQSSKRQGL